MTSKTVVERIAEAAWVALNFDNDPHDGQPHNTHAWNALTAAIRKAMRQDETSAPHRCRAMDLAEELRRYFDSGTLDEASDLYLLLKEVEAMRPVEPTYNPETVAAIKAALVAGGKVVCCQQFPDCECEPEKASDE